MIAAIFLPLAHSGHWTWLLYVPPVAIVLFSIVKTTIAERRGRDRDDTEDKRPK